ncbi:MAG: response regulator [FCB group bacterium]|nr:response regulator [FCB group bacterium]
MRKQVQKMANSAEGAAEVVQDLLTLARRGRYNMIKTNLNKVVESYLETPSFEKLQKDNPDVHLDIRLSEKMPIINGSTPHLNKVVMNLIVNAFDAMPKGGNLRIETKIMHIKKLLGGHDQIDEGEYVLLKVKDTGTGIAPEDIGKIFEPYFSKKEMGASGSGLGLSVVYGVVKDHNGYYDIISKLNEGTEFIMYFPKVTEAERLTEPQDITDGSAKGEEKVLVVDDDFEQREMAAELLESLGYIVDTVENGHKAIDYLESNTADIVTLDMIMEDGFDGLDTYVRITKINSEQKAIIVSGYSATDRVQKMQELGAGQYVKKPYTRETLGMAIRTELDCKSPIDVKSLVEIGG